MEKAVSLFNRFRDKLVMMFLFFLSTGMIYGQEGAPVDIDVERDSGGAWMGSWYFWIGLAVFIIIVVALVSGSRKKESL